MTQHHPRFSTTRDSQNKFSTFHAQLSCSRIPSNIAVPSVNTTFAYSQRNCTCRPSSSHRCVQSSPKAFLVRCCRGKNARVVTRLVGFMWHLPLIISFPVVSCSGRSSVSERWVVGIAQAKMRKPFCLKVTLPPRCCNHSPGTALLLPFCCFTFLALALTARTPLLATVSAVNATLANIEAARILLIPVKTLLSFAEDLSARSGCTSINMFSTCFARCLFVHLSECSSLHPSTCLVSNLGLYPSACPCDESIPNLCPALGSAPPWTVGSCCWTVLLPQLPSLMTLKPIEAPREDVEMRNDEDEKPLEAEMPSLRMNPKSATNREKQEHEDSGHAVNSNWCAACVEGRGVGGHHRTELSDKKERETTTPIVAFDHGFNARRRRHISKSD